MCLRVVFLYTFLYETQDKLAHHVVNTWFMIGAAHLMEARLHKKQLKMAEFHTLAVKAY